MSFVDIPNKKIKHPHYEHRTNKLDIKNNQFSSKKFQDIRKYSTKKKLIESFKRIGMCLNNKFPSELPINANIDKVCFILMNDYAGDDDKLGVGPLNDGYLIGLNHFRLDFKIFFLYNCTSNEYTSYLDYFIQHTTDKLTVFYSGRKDPMMDGIEFNDGTIIKLETDKIISKNCKYNQTHVMFITDCPCGGSVFNINGTSNVISFYTLKNKNDESEERKKMHGIITYYFCKFTSESPDITPNELADKMNSSLCRFDEIFECDMSCEDIGECSIFDKNAN